MKPIIVRQAPKRGQYDRGLSRRERQAAQRERVIGALGALCAANRDLSIANVVELSGVGRNTFYEYFDDIEHALNAIKRNVVHELSVRVEASARDARTPFERVRALARAWTDNLFADAALTRLALRAQPQSVESMQLSALAQHVATVLTAQRDSQSALPGLAEPLKIAAVAAIFDALSRVHLSQQQMSAQQLQGSLTDLSLRILR